MSQTIGLILAVALLAAPVSSRLMPEKAEKRPPPGLSVIRPETLARKLQAKEKLDYEDVPWWAMENQVRERLPPGKPERLPTIIEFMRGARIGILFAGVPTKPTSAPITVGGQQISFRIIPHSDRSSLDEWREWRAVVPQERPTVSPPSFYTAVGMFEADKLLPPTSERRLLVFRGLDAGWRRRYTRNLCLVPDSVCALDCKIGEFSGPAIEDFMRNTKPKEIVISWEEANNQLQHHSLPQLYRDVKGAIEHAKRGNPEVFIWVTVCVGDGADKERWATLIKDLPFDGVALWGIYALPVGWKGSGFLERHLLWAQRTFGNRPVALAGMYGIKAWQVPQAKVTEARAKPQELRPQVNEEAKRLGYAACWWQVGNIPNAIFDAAAF